MMNNEQNNQTTQNPPCFIHNVGGSFYRYESVQYASLGIDGEHESPKIPNPKVELRVYNLWKETPKGYWIGCGNLGEGKLRSNGIWVSKYSKRRYAYPTKKEALENFIKRNKRRIKILKYQVWSCELAVRIAEGMVV